MLTSAVAAPEVPTPVEEIARALEQVQPLQGLSLEDRLWLASHGTEVTAKTGDILFEEGAPAEHMVILLKGEIHVRRVRGGPMTMLLGRTALMTGLLPFSRMKSYGGQGRAVTPIWALLIPRTVFPEMLAAVPSMAQRSVSLLLDRSREVTRIEQQSEKLSALGKLAGNLAHELNNPASAAQRAAASLLTALRENRSNRFQLVNLCLTEEQTAAIEAWENEIMTRAGNDQQTDPARFLAAEESVRAWLVAKRCDDAINVAPPLVEQGVIPADLEKLATVLHDNELCVSLQFFARYLRSTRAADALVRSTAHIFELIEAVKTYSNMDRAQILDVDLPAGLDATVQMFTSRLGKVKVERDYEPCLPCISAYGGELNQIWTVLIENALDAMENQGELRLVCRREGDMVLVEVWNDGPGIPAAIQERIFEPFFTTKPPGRALGLGLDTAMRIVRKHRGTIIVHSRPGSTCFCVRLPLEQFQAY
jgi:signal transduction histidine kinase